MNGPPSKRKSPSALHQGTNSNSVLTTSALVGIFLFFLIALCLFLFILAHVVDSGSISHIASNLSVIFMSMILISASFLCIWYFLSYCIDTSLQAFRIRMDSISTILKLFLFLQIIFFISVLCCLYTAPSLTEGQFFKSILASHEKAVSTSITPQTYPDNNVVKAVKETELKQSELKQNLESAGESEAKDILPSSRENLQSTDLFPVRISLLDQNLLNTIVPPSSIARVTNLKVVSPSFDCSLENLFSFAVDFPDLQYRSRDEVRAQYPVIFDELPFPQDASAARAQSPAYDARFKSPCWESQRAPPGSGAPIDSDLTRGQLVCLPFAYVLGQPKCGTSDLFERLKQHQTIRMPRKKEVRWFTRGEFTTAAMPHEGDTDGARRERLLGPGSSVFSFTRFFAEAAADIAADRGRPGGAGLGLLLVDGGPHTLWWPTQSPDGSFLPEDVPPAQLLREMQPDAKFILTLTDPVKRMYSDYYFLEDNMRPVRPNGPNTVTSKSALQFHGRAAAQVRAFQRCVEDYLTFFAAHGQTDRLRTLSRGDNATWFRAAQMCAHDRHQFAKAGWGRVSIGLYFLFLEKWLEHFKPEQFLILRLEDYDLDPKAYMMKVFRFLDLGEPLDWGPVLRQVRFNQHRLVREPLLASTEQLLRDFYSPFNQLLATYTGDQGFLWEMGGSGETLRDQQLRESSRDQQQLAQGLGMRHRLPPPPQQLGQGNQHGLERHFEDPAQAGLGLGAEQLHFSAEKRLRGQGQAEGQGQGRGQGKGVTLTPGNFSTDGLPYPDLGEHYGPTDGHFRTFFNVQDVDAMLANPTALGNQLCTSSFGLDIPALRFLLLDKGVDPNLTSKQYASCTALHCVSELYSMADAHGRSHVFALLKGRESWLSPLLSRRRTSSSSSGSGQADGEGQEQGQGAESTEPFPLPLHLSSVMSKDIKDNLEDLIDGVAQWLLRAGASVDRKDQGGNLALHHAAEGGSLSLVRLLLAAGADPNQVNLEKRSPLHYALAFGHAEVAALLVQGGADLTLRDRNGVRPLDMAQNPGALRPGDALRLLNITQRPARQIQRRLHPELSPTDQRLGWVGGTGGWGPERMPGFEDDMRCDCIDQYFADEISGKDIYDQYIARNTPVLIRGLLGGWGAVQDYSQEALLAQHGELKVQVSDIPYAQKFGGAGSQEMTLAEYVEEVRAHRILGGSHPWYVFRGHPIPSVSESEQSLVSLERCPTPESIQQAFDKTLPPEKRGRQGKRAREAFINAQWALGGEGTGAPIHFHNTAWSALIYGAKKWIIYPPHHQIMSNKQILDFYETDMRNYSRRGIPPLTCVQTAGDVIIIPENWGHGVLNIQESIAIASEARTGSWRIRPIAPIYEKFPGFKNGQDKIQKKELEKEKAINIGPILSIESH